MKKHIVALLIFVCCLNLLLVHKLNDNTHRYDNNVLALKDTIEYYQSKNNELVATKLAFEAELSDIKNLNKSLYDEIKSLKTKSKVKSGITYSGVIENTPHDTVYSIVPDTVSRCFLREFSFKNPYRELSGNILYANDSLKLKFSKDIVNFDYTIAIDKKNNIYIKSSNPYVKYNEISGFQLPEKKKRFFIGPGINIGYDAVNKNFSPSIGIVAGYGLIRF